MRFFLNYLLIILLCIILIFGDPFFSFSGNISLDEERKIGREAAEEVINKFKIIDDYESLIYIRRLGDKLIKQLPEQFFTYQFYIIDDFKMNAFAIPGGFIFIQRGIINLMEDESELVGVLAHEIAHIYHRHITNRVDKIKPVGIVSLVGVLTGLVLSISGSLVLGSAVTAGSMASGMHTMLAFSREDEIDADYSGYLIMTKAGYSGQGMILSFKRMWKMEQFINSDTPSYLSTHPTSSERIERIEAMVNRYPVLDKPYDNSEFLMIKTKLKALYEPEDQVMNFFLTAYQERPNDPLALYGLALVLMRLDRYKEALNQLKILQRLWSKTNFLYLVKKEQGKCYLFLGEYDRALELYGDLVLYKPNDKEVLMGLAETYVRSERWEAAQQILFRLINFDEINEQVYYNLGVVLGKQGKIAESSLYLGKFFAKRGNDRAARFHLSQAKGAVNNPEIRRQVKIQLDKLG